MSTAGCLGAPWALTCPSRSTGSQSRSRSYGTGSDAFFPDAVWVVFGHLADCNLHVNIMVDPSGAENAQAGQSLV